MAAKVLPSGKENAMNSRVNEIINQVFDAKKTEIEMGDEIYSEKFTRYLQNIDSYLFWLFPP